MIVWTPAIYRPALGYVKLNPVKMGNLPQHPLTAPGTPFDAFRRYPTRYPRFPADPPESGPNPGSRALRTARNASGGP